MRKAAELRPARTDILAHLAFVYSQTGEHLDALMVADRVLEIAPSHIEALNAKGLAFRGLERSAEAISCFRDALKRDQNVAATHVNLGLALAGEGESEAALGHFRDAVRIDPDNIQALNNLGNALVERLDLSEAEQHLRDAVRLDPDFAEAHFNLAMALLMQAKFDEGWVEYEWRWKCPEFPSTRREFSYPVWHGQPLGGESLLVWSEQGVGDEVMFANPLPDVAAVVDRLIIECNPRFVPIFQRSYPAALVVARSDPADPRIEEANPDYQIPLASLCFHYRRGRDKFPTTPGAYLRADPVQTSACRARYEALGPGLKIGISWRSGNPIVGQERSTPLALWDDILSKTGCQFINLQYGEVENDLAGVRERLGVDVFVDRQIDPLGSMDDWLAQVAAMDMVISVDNSTVQVSGSLGVPTWTLLSYVPEWRWLAEGTGNPWHPHMQVIRQRNPGEWKPVFADVVEVLEQRLTEQALST